MICYKDTTYCVSKDCVNKSCKRRMTDEIQNKANKLCIPVSLEDGTGIHNLFALFWISSVIRLLQLLFTQSLLTQ